MKKSIERIEEERQAARLERAARREELVASAEAKLASKVGRLMSFFVPGVPLPKGSPEIRIRGSKRFVRESDELYAWQEAVAMVATVYLRKTAPRWELLDRPVALDITYTLPRRKSAKPSDCCVELAAVKPDIDKCERAILDALTGVIYTNDSRVTSVHHRKRAARHGEPQDVGVRIVIGLDTEE